MIEKNTTWTSNFETEPYEAGWAMECRWFIRVMTMEGSDTYLTLTPQISPDGLFWCGEGRSPLVISRPGLSSFPLRNFGNWLRLRAEVRGVNPSIKIMVYLALKE